MYKVNDFVYTKKKHVCGSNKWLVLRTGIEIRLRCDSCGREIMIMKKELDKKVVKSEVTT
jgi:hypothetical protein